MYDDRVFVWFLRSSVFVGLLSAVVTVIYLTPIPELQHASCLRPCHELDWPMICRVRLVLETSSVAKSVDQNFCPHNGSVCIESAGNMVVTANGHFPGPIIEVCEKDILVVDVVNRVPGAAVTVHWRGQSQHGTPFMDGTPMVTQCPINTFTTFQYKFRAVNPGTHMWQVHTGNRELDSLFGGLIVRQAPRREPHHDLYDIDNHFVLISELPSADNRKSHTLLINGEPFGKNGLTQFNVTAYKKHRLRIMYTVTSFNCPISVMVKSHSILVIALDGQPIRPVETQTIRMAPGERVDAVLTADQDPGDYELIVESISCVPSWRGAAVISYQLHQNAQSNPLSKLPDHRQTAIKSFSTMEDPECSDVNSGFICLSKIQSIIKLPPELSADKLPFTLYLPFDFVKPPPHIGLIVPRINNLTLTFPSTPLLSHASDTELCDVTSRPARCKDSYICQCIHVINIPLHTPVEFILVNQGGEGANVFHAFHLHGYTFHVVGMAVGQGLDKVRKDKLSRHLHSPVVKDTISVPAGGAVAIRFKANNPGYWLIHDERWQGLGAILHVGSVDDVPPLPENFPTCGDFIGPEFFLI